MAFPSVIVEVAFATDDDETLYATGGWSDITSWVRSISGFLRGRNYETNRTEAGNINVELDNLDGRFTPNRLSPYWPYIEPEKRFRIRGKNMVGQNIALGGGQDHSDELFLWPGDTINSAFLTNTQFAQWAQHTPNGAPSDDHIQVTVTAGVNSYARLITWIAPIETATRLAHSAYVWKVSGTEPVNSDLLLEMFYFDNEGNELLSDYRPAAWVTNTPTSPTRLSFSHAPYGSAEYAVIMLTARFETTLLTDITYAITGIQTELPDNLAANISANYDVVHWQYSLPQNMTIGTTVVETDLFTRSTSNGWGSNVEGLAWANFNGVSSEYSTNGTKGLQSVSGLGQVRTNELPVSLRDFDVTVTAGISAAPAGAGTNFVQDVFMRYVDANNYVSFRIFRNVTGNNVTCNIRQVVGGVTSAHASFPVVGTVTSGQDVTMRFQGTGNALLGKAWLAGSAEPSSWALTYTTTHTKAGYLRLQSDGNTVTGTYPLVGQWDNLSLSTGLYINRHEPTGSAELVWSSSFVDMFQVVTHLIPGETYSVAVQLLKLGGGPNIQVTADDGLTGPILSTDNSWTTMNMVFEAKAVTQAIRFIPQSTVASGDILRLRGLNIQKTNNPSLPLANGTDTGETVWERPKDIFEGWVEKWPWKAQAGMSNVTVVDRLSRIGEIDLANTLPEALNDDDADLVISFADEPGSEVVAWSGTWAEDSNLAEIPIISSKGSVLGATYTLGEIGMTEEPAIQFTRAVGAAGAGYYIEVPHTVIDAPPPPVVVDPTPPPAPPPPPKVTYTRRWEAIWSRTYNGDDLLTRFDDTPHMYQGTFDGANGNYRSLAGFYWQDIQATLTGAEILEVYITLKNQHWRWNAGESVHVGTHTYASKPSSWNAANIWVNRWDVWYGEGQWKGFQVGNDVGYDFARGFWKGIAIGPGSGGSVPNADYGYFNGATESNKPALTVVYRK